MQYRALRLLPRLGAAFVLATLAQFSLADPSVAQDSTSADQAAIRQAGQAYFEAHRRGDAKALASAWTQDGKYVDATGKSYPASNLSHESVDAESDPTELIDFAWDADSSIRIIAPNVAIEEGVMARSSNGRITPGAGTYTAVWVKQGDRWLLNALCESQSESVSESNPVEQLQWMLGEWTASGDTFQAHCKTDWSENRKFIVSQFTVERPGGQVLTGTQRIGWDPAASLIRSWVFDSDGGFSQGIWRREGDAWIVRNIGVLPDGRRSSAANFWLPEGDDRYVMKSSHMEVNDMALEDIELEFHRVGERP
jgi:ketosteroid isomerase-like protein